MRKPGIGPKGTKPNWWLIHGVGSGVMKIAANVCSRKTPEQAITSHLTAGVMKPRQSKLTFGAPNLVPISAVYGGRQSAVKSSIVEKI